MTFCLAFFPSVLPDDSTDEIEFYHKSQQEYMAARYVGQEIIKTRKGIGLLIYEAIEEYERTIESVSETTRDLNAHDFMNR